MEANSPVDLALLLQILRRTQKPKNKNKTLLRLRAESEKERDIIFLFASTVQRAVTAVGFDLIGRSLSRRRGGLGAREETANPKVGR